MGWLLLSLVVVLATVAFVWQRWGGGEAPPSCESRLQAVKAGLLHYAKTHQGRLPPSLSDLALHQPPVCPLAARLTGDVGSYHMEPLPGGCRLRCHENELHGQLGKGAPPSVDVVLANP